MKLFNINKRKGNNCSSETCEMFLFIQIKTDSAFFSDDRDQFLDPAI